MKPRPEPPDNSALGAQAARWTVRRDRGLSATEAIEFELWLAADERRAAAMERAGGTWARLDQIADDTAASVLTASRRRGFWRRALAAGSLAAAAAVALVFFRFGRAPVTPGMAAAIDTGPHQIVLSDGTIVQLNTGGEMVEQFTAAERRVHLVRGEAHFTVTKNPARPFIVRAGGVEVRAVGTAFNVNLQSAAVDVLVTEGVVQLRPTPGSAPEHAAVASVPLLNRGERAFVALVPVSPALAVVVTTADAAEMARTLAWQEPLLRLRGATLAEVAHEFEQRTGRRVTFADPALAGLRVGGRFRADDTEGFAHLLATTLDLKVERAVDGTLVLRKKKAE